MQYLVFTDESYITDSRFQSLSAFSFHKQYYDSICFDLTRILSESSVSEFKWNKLKDAKYFFCAEKMINYTLENIYKYKIRVDTIVWDTHDSRHKILQRNDIANYERMFFHLLNNSMKKRPRGSTWSIYPDVRGGIDWSTVHDCLRNIGNRSEYVNSIFGAFFTDNYYNINTFEERVSHHELPIQIADLFSGLSVFSRENYNTYKAWQTSSRNSSFNSLFDAPEEISLSKREEFRSKLLDGFNLNCKKLTLGVSLDTKRYLHTYKPENPINFWHYMPQGDHDTAPRNS